MAMTVPPSVLPEGQTAIGFMNDKPDPAVPLDTITIPEDYRLHAMVLGATGSGKSTIFKLLILQNLLRGEGLAIFDPHHDLAAWAAQRIPKWRANQLVYISPAQLARTGKAIPINPLELGRGAPAQAATEFAETLLKAFDTKGVQMHQLLREAATSLIAAKRGGLGLLRRIIIDKSVRDEVLSDVHIQDNLDFWDHIFERMQKESITHVDNKITPITSNPAVGPFFEGNTSFDLVKLIAGGGIVIFDGAGCSNDGERMLFTTFLLNMITQAATEHAQSLPQGTKPRRFYLYVDEMQMLESDKLQEMLQQVRKLGIRMTLATQQLESIDSKHAAAMLGNCDLYLVSRCTLGTAKLVFTKMGVDADTLVKIPKYHMNFHMSLPEGDIHGKLLRTRDMDKSVKYWETLEEIVDRSLENYGVDVDLTKYTNTPASEYSVTPLEAAALCAMYHNPNGLTKEDVQKATARFGPTDRRIAQLLSNMARLAMVTVMSGDTATTHRLRPECLNRHFDVAALKGRAGGDLHINTIIALQDHYTRRGWYTRMDVGETTDPMPDLEVCEPAAGPNGDPDPERWGRRVAVEVETGPGRHPNKPGKPGQVYKNWEKSHRAMTVWFLVYNEHDQHVIEKQLDEMNVGRDKYECTVISSDEVIAGVAVPVPPGFVPADPLPGCSAGRPLDELILGLIPADGVRVTGVRALVPSKYEDVEVAEAIDRLKDSGRLKTGMKGRSEVLSVVM